MNRNNLEIIFIILCLTLNFISLPYENVTAYGMDTSLSNVNASFILPIDQGNYSGRYRFCGWADWVGGVHRQGDQGRRARCDWPQRHGNCHQGRTRPNRAGR